MKWHGGLDRTEDRGSVAMKWEIHCERRKIEGLKYVILMRLLESRETTSVLKAEVEDNRNVLGLGR
jgi:hypothetical protein